MRLFKLTTLAAALSTAIPAHAAETTLAEVLVQSDRDDFAARQDARSTKLVYGRESWTA